MAEEHRGGTDYFWGIQRMFYKEDNTYLDL